MAVAYPDCGMDSWMLEGISYRVQLSPIFTSVCP
jgi:hypothetical protein